MCLNCPGCAAQAAKHPADRWNLGFFCMGNGITVGNRVGPGDWPMEFDRDYYLGLATILQQVIEEADGLCLTACDDSSGRTYLIYQPRYPWEITEKELDLTEDKLNELFSRYVSILTDDPIEIDAQEVENGG